MKDFCAFYQLVRQNWREKLDDNKIGGNQNAIMISTSLDNVR